MFKLSLTSHLCLFLLFGGGGGGGGEAAFEIVHHTR